MTSSGGYNLRKEGRRGEGKGGRGEGGEVCGVGHHDNNNFLRNIPINFYTLSLSLFPSFS